MIQLIYASKILKEGEEQLVAEAKFEVNANISNKKKIGIQDKDIITPAKNLARDLSRFAYATPTFDKTNKLFRPQTAKVLTRSQTKVSIKISEDKNKGKLEPISQLSAKYPNKKVAMPKLGI